MNTRIRLTGLMRPLAIAALLLGAFGFSQQAVAGIASTKHNLGTTGTGTNHQTTGTAEICVFCHTPHGANTAAAAPLWNKPTNAGSYTTYASLNSATIDGVIGQPGGVSLACLSCHDGSQAMDTVINAPGSGGYNSGGLAMSGSVWTGSATMAGVAMLNEGGVGLKNDHPIGIQYCGGSTGGSNVAVTNGTCKDNDFYGSANNNTRLNVAAAGGWVDTEATPNSTKNKTDMLLYASTGTGQGAGAQVECASCHDPHSQNQTFLRISNDGSAVCLACHVK